MNNKMQAGQLKAGLLMNSSYGTQIFPFNLTVCNIKVTIKSADCD